MKKFLICLLIVPFFISCGSQEKPVADSSAGNKVNVNIPSYEVLDTVNRIDGSGIHAGVLIESYNTETPDEELLRVAQAIAKDKGFSIIEIYCTKDAQKANYSSSFSEAHPGALDNGFLGTYEHGEFKKPIKY